MSPPKWFFETASEVQSSVHSVVQTSCELLVVMVSHSFVQDSERVCMQVVVSVVVQLALHIV
jgi:hypothetical protein